MNLSEMKKLLTYKVLPAQNYYEVNELIDSHIRDVQDSIRNTTENSFRSSLKLGKPVTVYVLLINVAYKEFSLSYL